MSLAEKSLQDSPKSSDTQATDFAWLEVLNNATLKVRMCYIISCYCNSILKGNRGRKRETLL